MRHTVRAASVPSLLRVALLYSGRLFDFEVASPWADNHLESIIRPNHASVFVTVDPTNWCGAPPEARRAYGAGQRAIAEAALQAQVRLIFRDYQPLHASLVYSENPAAPGWFGQAGIKAMERHGTRSDRAAIFIHKWYMQFDHYAKAEALRAAYGPHELVVRVRMDVEFTRPILLQPAALSEERGRRRGAAEHGYAVVALLQNGTRRRLAHVGADRRQLEVGVHYGMAVRPLGEPPSTMAYKRCTPSGEDLNVYDQRGALNPPCPADSADGADGATSRLWSDWFFVGPPAALAPLAGMTSRGLILTSNSSRCYGLCQEEQTVLQLEDAGVGLVPLSLPLRMRKIAANPCGSAPLLNLSQLSQQHGISSWYAPCPPAQRGCNRRAGL